METGFKEAPPGGPTPGFPAIEAERALINSKLTIALAGLIIATGALTVNLMPLLLVSLANARALSESQVGFFASAVMSGALVGTTVSVLWIRRFSWTRATGFAALAAAGGLLGLAAFDSYSVNLLLGFVLGYGQASMIASPIAMISDSDEPSRNFSVIVAMQVAMASALAAAIPFIDAAGSFPGTMAVLAAITLACAALAPRLPAKGLRGNPDSPSVHGSTPASNAPVFLCLGGLLIFYVGLAAVWGFSGILAEAWGLSQGEIASAVSVSLVAGLAGSVASGLLADRIPSLAAVALGLAGVGGSFYLFSLEGGYWLFLFALTALNCAWNFSLAYQLGLIASFDRSGRFAVLLTASQTAGAILGPGLMGLILNETEGFSTGLAFSGFWLIAAFGFFWKAVRSNPLQPA